jgi:predicted Zn-dependent protease
MAMSNAMKPVSKSLTTAQAEAASGLPARRLGMDAACCCARPGRRLFGAAVLACGAGLAFPGRAREGVDVGPPSTLSKLVPVEQVEGAATQQYSQLLQQASARRDLVPESHPQVQRLRYIAQRLIPFTYAWNPRARKWRWEVNVIGSPKINAFCMPGGKIAFYYGILERLKLSDDEVAMIMGHEMTHALREHAREQMGKTMATRGVLEIGSAIFGLGNAGRAMVGMGGQLLTLRFSREDETEADLVGLELAARAGYDPEASVSLWQKMARTDKSALPDLGRTHPSGPNRIREIRANLPKVEPLYARAAKPPQRFGPPAPRAASGRPGASAN